MSEIFFIYDGECPLCSRGAEALRIKQSVGTLKLLDARMEADHPLVQEVGRRRLDLDEGMVIVYEDRFYLGADALHLMALLGSGQGWFNKINAALFRSEKMARFCYPAMRAGRNLLIRMRGVDKIDNLNRRSEPIFKSVFGEDWERLPPVMRRHYANRPYCDEVVATEGRMDVVCSPVGRLLMPFFLLAGALVPRTGRDVPVTVHFKSDPKSNAFQYDRVFHFPGRKPTQFFSRMVPLKDNELVEYMRFGVGWRLAVTWTGEKLLLSHMGYVWKVFGWHLPLPLGLLIGAGNAEEVPLSDSSFEMMMEIRHPWWGLIYGYSGRFHFPEAA